MAAGRLVEFIDDTVEDNEDEEPQIVTVSEATPLPCVIVEPA